MPRGDRTGPEGAGQMTGRGLGYCSGNQSAGFNRGFGAGNGYRAGGGMGRGRGAGFGRGFNNAALPPAAPVQNAASFQEEARSLMDRLKGLLDSFEKPAEKE